MTTGLESSCTHVCMRTPVMSSCLACIVLFINFLKYILFYFSPGTRGGTKAWQLPYLTIQLTPLYSSSWNPFRATSHSRHRKAAQTMWTSLKIAQLDHCSKEQQNVDVFCKMFRLPTFIYCLSCREVRKSAGQAHRFFFSLSLPLFDDRQTFHSTNAC